jgi:putative oxidoreductase
MGVMTNDVSHAVILTARLFLAALFLIFGWRKLRDRPGTISQMMKDGVPLPMVATAIAIFMELPVAFAVAVGAFTRPSAALFVLYTFGTSLVEHRYWKMTGVDRLASMESFYKNLAIIGGFLLLYVEGAGKYSIDALCNIAAR